MSTKTREHDRKSFQELAKLASQIGKPEQVPSDVGREPAPDDEWRGGSGVLDLASIPPTGSSRLPARIEAVAGPSDVMDAKKVIGQDAKNRSPLWLGVGAATALFLALALVASSRVAPASALAASAAPRSTDVRTLPTPFLSGSPPSPDIPGIDPSRLPLATSAAVPSGASVPAVLDPKSRTVAKAANGPLAATQSPSSIAIPGAVSSSSEPRALADGPSNLDSLMRQAVGGASTALPAQREDADSKGPPPPSSTESLPLKPSLGSLQSALRSEMPAARACLDSDDAVSRATITFRSDGSVEGVAVAGGASGRQSEACVRATLSKTRVPPFTQATFVFQTTVRPN
jgi:hypothetical protein